MGWVYTTASMLVIPLAVLLFAQWPLRELLGAYSREANDIAQILFALYVAIAVTAASRARAHLAAHSASASTDDGSRARRLALLLCIAPWAALVLWTSAGQVMQSVLQLERFSETANPGYFLIRIAAWLLALLALVHAGCSAFAATRRP